MLHFQPEKAPSTGTWRRIRAALMRAPHLERVSDEIHPNWCDCSDCSEDPRRRLRGDLKIIAAGLAAAIAAGALLGWLGPL